LPIAASGAPEAIGTSPTNEVAVTHGQRSAAPGSRWRRTRSAADQVVEVEAAVNAVSVLVSRRGRMASPVRTTRSSSTSTLTTATNPARHQFHQSGFQRCLAKWIAAPAVP
jgi:hypothetical protein